MVTVPSIVQKTGGPKAVKKSHGELMTNSCAFFIETNKFDVIVYTPGSSFVVNCSIHSMADREEHGEYMAVAICFSLSYTPKQISGVGMMECDDKILCVGLYIFLSVIKKREKKIIKSTRVCVSNFYFK